MRSDLLRSLVLLGVASAVCGLPEGAFAEPVLDRVLPTAQRVQERIVLSGSGFGAFDPGASKVLFCRAGGPGRGTVAEAVTPYVWRDGHVEVRVPVAAAAGAPGPPGALRVRVVRAGGSSEDGSSDSDGSSDGDSDSGDSCSDDDSDDGVSNPVAFRVVRAAGGRPLAFRELTEISGDRDVSEALGDPAFNLERTKDAEVGDVDGDGFPDLVDSNSNNFLAIPHSVLRLNDGAGGFSALALEPAFAGDAGPFATEVPSGDFLADGILYDADLVDLTNDGRPELVQAVAFFGKPPAVRVLRHRGAGPVFFVEDTAAWLPAPGFAGSPDDLDHGDLDQDGFVDVAVALRGSPGVELLLNRGGSTFGDRVTLTGSGGSAHDVFLLDADRDGRQDAVVVDETGVSSLFLNSGGSPPEFVAGTELATGVLHQAGAAADLDGDGLDDFVLAGWNGVAPVLALGDVFLNDPADPGTFLRVPLPAPGPGILYDLELGDVDLDGDVDIVGAVLRLLAFDGDDAVVVWLNAGDGSFTEATAGGATRLFPGSAPYQRLSVDLLDLELDGDLDLYLTGADLQFFGAGLGSVPNQLFENLLVDE